MIEDEHVDQRRDGRGDRNGEDDRKASEQEADDRDRDEGHHRRQPDGLAHQMRVHHVALELADDDEDQQAQRGHVDRLGQADADDQDRSDQRPDHGHDLDQPDETAEQQRVVQPDEIEPHREHRADDDDHQELQAGVGAQPAVDGEIRAARALSRFASGASADSSPIIRSRSEIQYQVAASVNRTPTTASVAFFP